MRIREGLGRRNVAVEQCITIPIEKASDDDHMHSVVIALMTYIDS